MSKVHVSVLDVFMASDEYGQEKMDEIAMNALAWGDADVVTVHEHGGWWLQYIADYIFAKWNDEFLGVDNLTVIGSANGGATYTGKAAEFRDLLLGMRERDEVEFVHLPCIRRKSAEEVEA